MNIDLAIAKILKKIRENKGISQEQLAFEANLHRTYISQIERGLKSITVKTLLKITQPLEIRIDEFIKLVADELENIQSNKRTKS